MADADDEENRGSNNNTTKIHKTKKMRPAMRND